jgi:hypothetical protein
MKIRLALCFFLAVVLQSFAVDARELTAQDASSLAKRIRKFEFHRPMSESELSRVLEVRSLPYAPSVRGCQIIYRLDEKYSLVFVIERPMPITLEKPKTVPKYVGVLLFSGGKLIATSRLRP